MSSFQYPYYADPATLPAKLPTIEEIHSSQDVLSDQGRKKVVGVGDHFIVKYGFGVAPLEAETTLFLQLSTKIAVPTVYAFFQVPEPGDPDLKKGYFIMERINGKTLVSEWPDMDETAKKAVVVRLQSIFKELRALESPGGYCSVGHNALTDAFSALQPLQPPFSGAGPFESEADFNEAMTKTRDRTDQVKPIAKFFSWAFSTVLRNHPPVFSHGDVQKKNIMVRTSVDSSHNGDEQKGSLPDIVLIDWESAGWYPSYWEFLVALFAREGWDDDWAYWIEEFLDPALCEFGWVYMFITQLHI
ncbi:MAG: hypothetical protein M1822_008163 [Bathelium mastoideum]|nr:MAG: hypothetical protein M1822_008163 [Bathelium mastoideum]